MAKYRKKPVVVEAVQWFKLGDHSVVTEFESKYGTPVICVGCGKSSHDHGNCPTLEGYHIVCPGDWIICGVKGEYYPCKPDIFKETYEKVE
jgi:hypothetical protein